MQAGNLTIKGRKAGPGIGELLYLKFPKVSPRPPLTAPPLAARDPGCSQLRAWCGGVPGCTCMVGTCTWVHGCVHGGYMGAYPGAYPGMFF